MTDAENIQRLLATFNDTLYSWDLHEILQVLQEHATIIRSMDVAKTNTRHWYPSYLTDRLRAPKTQELTWTYARLFQELQLNSRRSEISDDVHIILHFILVLNEKLQELIQRSILYINPRHPDQYRILRSHEFNEAKNFELITRRHLRKKDGSILPWLGDAHKVIGENLCHFDEGEHSEDFVEFTEYIRATTTSIKTRFTQVANKIDKERQELYQEPAILELKQEFLEKLWRPFLYRPSKPLMEPDRSPFDEQYAWHYTRVYDQCASSQSNRYEKWDWFVYDFNFRDTMTHASDQHVFGYNLAEEDGIRSTLERYYTLTWPEDDDVAEYPGFARTAPVFYAAVATPAHVVTPSYVQFAHPSLHAAAHVIPSAGFFFASQTVYGKILDTLKTMEKLPFDQASEYYAKKFFAKLDQRIAKYKKAETNAETHIHGAILRFCENVPKPYNLFLTCNDLKDTSKVAQQIFDNIIHVRPVVLVRHIVTGLFEVCATNYYQDTDMSDDEWHEMLAMLHDVQAKWHSWLKKEQKKQKANTKTYTDAEFYRLCFEVYNQQLQQCVSRKVGLKFRTGDTAVLDARALAEFVHESLLEFEDEGEHGEDGEEAWYVTADKLKEFLASYAPMTTSTACYLAPSATYQYKHKAPKREYDFKFYLRSGEKKVAYQQLDDEVKALISDFVNTYHISKYTWDDETGSFRAPQNGKRYYETMTSNRRRYTMSGVEHNDPWHNDLVITGLRYGTMKVVPINR